MSIDTYLEKKSKTSLLSIGMALTLAVGVLDYITCSERRIDVFYLLPISFVVWYLDDKARIIISMISALSIFITDHLVSAFLPMSTTRQATLPSPIFSKLQTKMYN